MSFKNFINQEINEVQKEQKKEQIKENVVKSDDYYFNMTDPETDEKYDIPMLSTSDPDYYYKYVYYMKLKEKVPETFEQILSWT